MISRTLQRKLDLAIEISRGLDEPFDTMMQTHGVVVSPIADTIELSNDGELCVSPHFLSTKRLPVLIAVFMHEARHHQALHHGRWRELKEEILCGNIPLPDSWLNANRSVNWNAILPAWHVAIDLEIIEIFERAPIMKDQPHIRFSQWPCTHIHPCMQRNAEQIWMFIKNNEAARKEIADFGKEQGYT